MWWGSTQQLLKVEAGTDQTLLYGGEETGDNLRIKANSFNAYPELLLTGNSTFYMSWASGQELILRDGASDVARVRGENSGGQLILRECTTPTTLADHGLVYTKNDNKLYFMDGAGVEHEVAFV